MTPPRRGSRSTVPSPQRALRRRRRRRRLDRTRSLLQTGRGTTMRRSGTPRVAPIDCAWTRRKGEERRGCGAAAACSAWPLPLGLLAASSPPIDRLVVFIQRDDWRDVVRAAGSSRKVSLCLHIAHSRNIPLMHRVTPPVPSKIPQDRRKGDRQLLELLIWWPSRALLRQPNNNCFNRQVTVVGETAAVRGGSSGDCCWHTARVEGRTWEDTRFVPPPHVSSLYHDGETTGETIAMSSMKNPTNSRQNRTAKFSCHSSSSPSSVERDVVEWLVGG